MKTRAIKVGDTFQNRSNTKTLKVTKVTLDNDGNLKKFSVARENGTEVTITAAKLDAARALLAANGSYPCQAKPVDGGVEYTAAKDVAIAWALKLTTTTTKTGQHWTTKGSKQ